MTPLARRVRPAPGPDARAPAAGASAVGQECREQPVQLGSASRESQAQEVKERAVFHVDTGGWQWASFSPPQTAGSRPSVSHESQRRGGLSSREGYRYSFSPAPPSAAGSQSARDRISPASIESRLSTGTLQRLRQMTTPEDPDLSARQWSPPMRSSRGWSQFTEFDCSQTEAAPPEQPTPGESESFRHPFKPDLTPRRFWESLHEINSVMPRRQAAKSQSQVSTDAYKTLGGAGGTPNAVPKLSRTKQTKRSSRPSLDLNSGGWSHEDPAGNDDATLLTRSNSRKARMSLNSRFATGVDDGSNSAGSLGLTSRHSSFQSAQLVGLRKSPVEGTVNGLGHTEKGPGTHRMVGVEDSDVMALPYTMLGIHHTGKRWDLRGKLKSHARTLEIMQVATHIPCLRTIYACIHSRRSCMHTFVARAVHYMHTTISRKCLHAYIHTLVGRCWHHEKSKPGGFGRTWKWT